MDVSTPNGVRRRFRQPRFALLSMLLLACLASSASAADELLGPEFRLADWSNDTSGWKRCESDHVVLHAERATADESRQILAACEHCIARLQAFWSGEREIADWQPKCIVVVHRTPESYVASVGASAGTSWGRALVTRERGRVTSRRIDLCATTPSKLVEHLPHELQHIVLADRFPASAPPRWLDEGTALLAEPTWKLERRERHYNSDYTAPLFRSAELLTMSAYPPGERAHGMYVESHQLVRLLLARGGAPRLLAFVSAAQQSGYDAALREQYGVAGLAQLDELRRSSKNKAGLVEEASVRSPRPLGEG